MLTWYVCDVTVRLRAEPDAAPGETAAVAVW